MERKKASGREKSSALACYSRAMMDDTTTDVPDPAELKRFRALRDQLPQVWDAMQSDPTWEHTSVIVPSLSVNQEELSKVQGATFYEERLLFGLIRLRNPRARVIYVTSQPIHPDIIDYYLQLLVGVPARHAQQRLFLLCMYDGSPRPLSQKILERPRVLDRIRRWIGDPFRAYLTVYNSTELERKLAVALEIPLNALDPDLLWLGTKSGSRKLFKQAGINCAYGMEDLNTEDEVIDALVKIAEERPGIKRAVVKLNEGFSGEGNGIFRYPDPLPEDPEAQQRAISDELRNLQWAAPESYTNFMRKFSEMGGIVEEFLEAKTVHSPSVQLRIHPDGRPALVSSHDQILGGSTGQVYLGCRFPADDDYRTAIQSEAVKVAELLSGHGVVSRFGIDFLVYRDSDDDPWKTAAVEINLRMGGTTPPFMALEFLTGGDLSPVTGLFHSPDGRPKYYYSTDNLRSPAYRGLLPEDFMEILVHHGIHFRHAAGTGVLFFMIGALSQYGKLGVTCVGDSREEADQLYQQAVAVLDHETEAAPRTRGRLYPMFYGSVGKME